MGKKIQQITKNRGVQKWGKSHSKLNRYIVINDPRLNIFCGFSFSLQKLDRYMGFAGPGLQRRSCTG